MVDALSRHKAVEFGHVRDEAHIGGYEDVRNAEMLQAILALLADVLFHVGDLHRVRDVVAASQPVRHEERGHLRHDGHVAHAASVQAVAEAQPVRIALLPGGQFFRSQKAAQNGAEDGGVRNEQRLVQGPEADEETAQLRIDAHQDADDHEIEQRKEFARQFAHER